MTRPVHLRAKTAAIMQALRAGTMEYMQLEMRFGDCGGELSRLVRAGYATRSADRNYRLTPEGRAACPNRRDT